MCTRSQHSAYRHLLSTHVVREISLSASKQEGKIRTEDLAAKGGQFVTRTHSSKSKHAIDTPSSFPPNCFTTSQVASQPEGRGQSKMTTQHTGWPHRSTLGKCYLSESFGPLVDWQCPWISWCTHACTLVRPHGCVEGKSCWMRVVSKEPPQCSMVPLDFRVQFHQIISILIAAAGSIRSRPCPALGICHQGNPESASSAVLLRRERGCACTHEECLQ